MGIIKDFLETEIRNAILNKTPLSKINKNSKHWKGYISLNGKLVAKVKIPNAHQKIMHSSKSTYIARDLKLDEIQFNNFVICSLSSDEYKAILEKIV
jgi:hypothetical protein